MTVLNCSSGKKLSRTCAPVASLRVSRDSVLRGGHTQRVGDGARSVHRESGAAHDRAVQLHGDDYHAAAGRRKVGVEGEPLHYGTAVDDAGVEVAGGVVEHEPQALLAQKQLVLVDEADDRGDDGKAVDAGLESHVGNGRVPVEQLNRRPLLCLDPLVQAEEVGGGCLRVQVCEQHPLPSLGVDGRQVHGGRGLAHAALVVAYSERPYKRLLCIEPGEQDVEEARRATYVSRSPL